METSVNSLRVVSMYPLLKILQCSEGGSGSAASTRIVLPPSDSGSYRDVPPKLSGKLQSASRVYSSPRSIANMMNESMCTPSSENDEFERNRKERENPSF